MRCGESNGRRLRFVTLLLVVGIQGIVQSENAAQKPLSPAHIDFFEKKIRPVLLRHCYKCHSADAKNLKGGLLLDSREAMRKGGDSGAAVVPKDVAESLLISALRQDGLEMPPEGKLPDAVIADFVKWIELGAPDPRDGHAATESQIDYDVAGKYWAFQPITQPVRPKVLRSDWVANEIDRFTLARMEQLGLVPVAAADKRELIRRATFDLIGLPPQPAHVTAFIEDESPAALEKVIDRLLGSEHYGERWGRYWLDVARYSEDQAHTFSVRKNTNGFRYRDWVVSAFNTDMPYDQFVKLQIAGDLIGPNEQGTYDHLVALGLFGLGAQYYKNSDAAQAAADELDDRVDTLTRGFLGLTVSCARCHDHKFDPIPTQDYYSLAGIFRSSKLNNAPLCAPEDIRTYNTGRERIKKSEAAVKKFLAEAKETAAASKVGDISKYMQAVWRYQVAAANGRRAKSSDLARQAGLNAFLLKRWIGFLDPKRKGQVSELDDWFALKPAAAEPIDSDSALPPAVAEVADGFQQRLQRLLGNDDGVATTNLVDTGGDKSHQAGSPRFVTPLVTKVRPTSGIDVDIRQAKQLFLVVSDGGNGKSCDHADWIAPRLIGSQGELDLTQVKWKSLEGFSGGRINKNYQGKPIRAGGKTYPRGVGVHAPTTIVYDLPPGYERFRAIGALDNSGSDQGGCGDQASVQFSVYTEKPVTGPVAPGKDLLSIVLGKDGPVAVSDKDLENFLTGPKREQLRTLRSEFEDAKKSAPAMYPIAHAYAEGNVADMHVFVRGDPARKREIAPRRFLRILAGEKRPLYTKGSGRRQLAEAIASAENPLTARVIVNRIWQHHFGRGIVATPSNFGKLGDAPTHPQLLDYLAAGFIDSGWSIKHVHRQIMLSATYRLSTSSHLANTNIDADNRFLWKMTRRRLDVEAWRDALLDVSGRLDRTRGGPSTNLADANNVRRTIYAQISRHELDSLLRLFDFPDANITSAKRSETTVPQQQLFVLNSPFMIAQAQAFSARLHREAPDSDEARIRRAFSLAYSRSPSAAEVMLGLDYLGGKPDPDNKLTNWETYAQVLLGANEFIYLD
ncbi:MAG: DUF1553 domain-containing protein [Planctomycetaceae bacterium]